MMKQLPDAKTMIAIKDLSLAAKTIVDGFMSGINSSRLKGEGVSFSQYRSYFPGDDLRNLDWKVFGRTGRYYIRQAETEKTIAVHLIVDASASMNHDCGGYRKIQYAAQLASALALLAYRQGDKVGLTVFNGEGVQRIPSKQHSQQLQRIYHVLGSMEAQGRFENLDRYKQLYQAAGRDLVVIITDFYEHQDELTKLTALLHAQRQEVILLHLMAENELEGRFKGYDALEDLETGEVIMLGPSAALAPQPLNNYLAATKKKLLNNQVYYTLVNANELPAQALRDFLVRRNKQSR
ncbi:DUF58 domain-containing protein [Parapedobacter sp. ISTM3]|uniref:DUF58 domain-containing protein n=1 Tax=Parapedobacter sp. ISTM3 TaxID=2800130 RepID=UPI0019041786|nr:DUF58 domain-containing protein [Parapedobacter sp. ISTM3]MBK1438564.1 DUF58 domain-containing protein [Parapedobacter sp. ISTM3]